MRGPGAPDFDPEAYWSGQHHSGEGLRSVGQAGLPEELNRWLYAIGRRNVLAFLDRHGIDSLTGTRVFDVGSGTGYWVDLWLELGAAQVDGCDLVPDAVERLRTRYPAGSFVAGDIAEAGTIPVDKSYGFVSVMNVLLHVIDDERFAAAARNVAAAVGSGGHLFLAEPALTNPRSVAPRRPGAASVARPLDMYRAAFEAAGLVFVDVGPSTVAGANPIERGLPDFRRHADRWAAAGRWARRGPRWADATGRVLSLADRWLMRSGQAPSGKLLLFRRPD